MTICASKPSNPAEAGSHTYKPGDHPPTEVEAWKETAAQEGRNRDYYRGLLDQVAEHLGPEVYKADDGTVSDSPLRAKIPALVGLLAERSKSATIAGALFDFAAYLTTRPGSLVVGSSHESSLILPVLKEWAALRGLSLDQANVLDWEQSGSR